MTELTATADQVVSLKHAPNYLKINLPLPHLVTAIDPSVNTLGIAIYKLCYILDAEKMLAAKEAYEKNRAHTVVEAFYHLAFSKTVEVETQAKRKRDIPHIIRIRQMIDQVSAVIEEETPFSLPGTVVIEEPESWGAYKSVASDKAGDMKLLVMTVGALGLWATQVAGIEETKLIKVSEWKGQLPKNVTANRMKAIYNTEHFDTLDEADAIGIGHYYIHKYIIPSAMAKNFKMRKNL